MGLVLSLANKRPELFGFWNNYFKKSTKILNQIEGIICFLFRLPALYLYLDKNVPIIDRSSFPPLYLETGTKKYTTENNSPLMKNPSFLPNLNETWTKIVNFSLIENYFQLCTFFASVSK